VKNLRKKSQPPIKQVTARRLAKDAIVITHPERVVYPDIGATKGDVAAYYAAVAKPLLREIARRPLSLVRCPRGTQKGCFFQKHTEQGFGKHVKIAMIEESSGTKARYAYVDDAQGLAELAQMNVIELHTWNTHHDDTQLCDRIVFDLDPGAGVAWMRIVDAARHLRAVLEKMQLQSFLRLSGGKGLHVVVPLNPAVSWEVARKFAEAFARSLASAQPDRFVAVSGEKNRKRKIFIDYLRNARGATSVANYSLRARAGAPVALPLRWEELARVRAPDAFTIRNVPARLKRSRKDPWFGIDQVRQRLPRLQAIDVAVA
jgi:bifunctional non-homologous end joining protein LigD